jgi:cyanophycinase-like exopeptidase
VLLARHFSSTIVGMKAEICLQGGAEFRPGCEPMDAALLRLPDGAPRRVLVLPFAGRPGRERELAGANAERWYRALGATQVQVVLREDDDVRGALAGLAGTGLVVLPGGSPAQLLESLQPFAGELRDAVERGTAISGASAGAMVLCAWTVLPGGTPHVVPALGVVPVDLVLPHFSGNASWLGPARKVLLEAAVVLGIPERSGALVATDGSLHAVGLEGFTRLTLTPSGASRT